MIAIDSNLLVYAADKTDREKHERAKAIVGCALDAEGIIPLQVLGEFLAVARRRLPADFPMLVELAQTWLTVARIVATTETDMIAAARLVQRHKFQFWDAVIWSVAAAAGARWFLSDDLQDGLSLDGMTVLNPLLPANAARLDEILPALPRFS